MPATPSSKPLPARELAPDESPRRLISVADYCRAGAVAVLLLLVATASQVVEPSPEVRTTAQFAHLASVVVGMGSVVVVDWFGLLWRFGRASLHTVVSIANALALPIWLGLGGLFLSGMFLSPDLSSPLTKVKLCVVAVTGVGGVLALALGRRLSAPGPSPSPRLLRATLGMAVASQVCWWTATVIGFMNRS